MTTTVNYPFGAKVLSPSTGIVLNNEMDDFSIPGVPPPGFLPPAPQNFVRPGKRPLSSMTPTIVLKVTSHEIFAFTLFVGCGEPTCTLVSWMLIFRYLTRNKIMG
jgi:gamma-glutamyltranspeptidase